MYISSPIGQVKVELAGDRVSGIDFARGRPRATGPENGASKTVARQLDEYFSGSRHEFDLELEPSGTPFQREVWRELARIPYGETRTYAQVAGAVQRPAAARAVGGACNANPISIAIPCHRVVGAGGDLTGYGGGMWRKRWLLEHEARHA